MICLRPLSIKKRLLSPLYLCQLNLIVPHSIADNRTLKRLLTLNDKMILIHFFLDVFEGRL